MNTGREIAFLKGKIFPEKINNPIKIIKKIFAYTSSDLNAKLTGRFITGVSNVEMISKLYKKFLSENIRYFLYLE